MHSQARAFLQPTRANIHKYQFNNPILLSWKKSSIYNISTRSINQVENQIIILEIQTREKINLAYSVCVWNYRLLQH